jgi:DNA-binding NarL/FixJ family response regulator
MAKIRILLLDEHAPFREDLSRLLDGDPEFELAGACAKVSEALDVLRQKPVDLVLLDYDLGKERGSEFMTKARQRGFEGRFLMVTAGMSDAESLQALELGVNGIFPKQSSPGVLTHAILKVMAGESWLDRSSVDALLEAARNPEPPVLNEPLTEREKQVLQGVLEGLTNKEIGARFGISESSIKAALQQLYQKTGVRTRSQLASISLAERQREDKVN